MRQTPVFGAPVVVIMAMVSVTWILGYVVFLSISYYPDMGNTFDGFFCFTMLGVLWVLIGLPMKLREWINFNLEDA